MKRTIAVFLILVMLISGCMKQQLTPGETKDLLGEDDPVYADFKTAVSVCENAHHKIESFVEKGNIIEDF